MSLPNFQPSPQRVSYGQVDGVIQPKWNVSEDGRGLLEGTLEIRWTQNDPLNPVFNTTLIPQRGDPHPFDTRLKCYKSNTNFGHNGEIMVSQSYIGLLQDPTYAETETSGTTSSQNVQLHPNFGSFAFKYPPTAQTINPPWKDYVIKAADNISFDKFSPLTAPEGLKGVDSYYAPRGTVKVTFYTSGMGTATRFLDNIGTYASTPVYANGPLPTGGNFLLTSVSVSTYGTVYKLSCEWMMSEQGVGWSETLYRKFGSGGSKSQNKYNILGVVGDFNLGTDPSLGIW